MKLYHTLLLCCSMILLGCLNEDLDGGIASCPNNATFVVDLSTPTFFDEAWLWISNQEQKVVHEEMLTGMGSSTHFANYPAACEDRYVIGMGGYQELISSGGGITKNIRLTEVSEVPSGLGLDIFPTSTFQTVTFFTEESALIILNCPPVDSVRYVPNIYISEGSNPPPNFNYEPSENRLTVYPSRTHSSAKDEMLAIRLTGTDDWRGEIIRLPTAANSQYDFAALDTLTLHTLAFPETETTANIIVRAITNPGQKATVELGRHVGNSISFPAPSTPEGILLYIKSKGYTEQTLHQTIPSDLVLSRSLHIDDFVRSDGQFRMESSGGDILQLTFYLRDEVMGTIGYRNYIQPAKEGVYSFSLPTVSDLYLSRNNSILTACQSSPQQGGTASLTHYPQLNGDYDTYLRKIISTPASRDWLLGQQYETFQLNF